MIHLLIYTLEKKPDFSLASNNQLQGKNQSGHILNGSLHFHQFALFEFLSNKLIEQIISKLKFNTWIRQAHPIHFHCLNKIYSSDFRCADLIFPFLDQNK